MSCFLFFVSPQVLSPEKEPSSPTGSTQSSVQVRKSSSANSNPQPSVSTLSSKPPSGQELPNRRKESEPAVQSLGSTDLEQASAAGTGGDGGGKSLAETGKSTSYLAISGSQQFLDGKEPTPSIASDISHPYAAQELQQRIQQLQKYV